METSSKFSQGVNKFASRLLRHGANGYRRFQMLMANRIPPDVAEEVACRMKKAARLLAAMVIGFLVLHVLAWPVMTLWLADPRDAYLHFNDLEAGLLLLGACMVSYLYRGGYGATLLFPLSVLACFRGKDVFESMNSFAAAATTLMDIAAFCAAGRFFDLIVERWFVRNDKGQAIGWGAAMSLLFFLYLLLVFLNQNTDYGDGSLITPLHLPWFTVGAVALGFSFLVTRGRAPGSIDQARNLFRWAYTRWQRQILGMFLAVVLGLVPLTEFIGFLGLHDRMDKTVAVDVPPVSTMAETRSGEEGRPSPLFRAQDGASYFLFGHSRFLTEDELDHFYIDVPSGDSDSGKNLDALSNQLEDDSGNLEITRKIRTALEPYRLSREKIEKGQLIPGRHLYEWHSNSGKRGALIGYPGLHRDLQGDGFDRLNAVYFRQYLDDSYWYQFALLFLGFFGFLILWRRGGDSWPARLIGIWLVAVGCGPQGMLAYYHMEGLFFQADQLAFSPAWLAAGNMISVAIAALGVLGLVFMVLCYAGIPTTLVGVWYCLPPRALAGWKWGLQLLRNVALTWIVGFAAIAVCNGITMTLREHYGQRDWFCVSFAVLIPLAVLIGARLRRRLPRPAPIGKWSVVAFVLLNTLTIITWAYALDSNFKYEGGQPAQTDPVIHYVTQFHAPVLIAIFADIAVFLTLLLDDFLNLEATRDLSFILVAVAIPGLMELFETSLDRLLAQDPLFSEDGILLISVLLAIACFPKLHQWLDRLCERWAMPRLYAVEEAVDEAIDHLVGLESEDERAAHLRALFERIHLGRYALYVRRKPGTFRRLVSYWNDQLQDEIMLSEPLERLLGEHKRFIDFHKISGKWKFFFLQFELRRIENAFSKPSAGEAPSLICRYLLPICVGKTVCAVLFLPGGVDDIDREPLANALNSVGLAAMTQK